MRHPALYVGPDAILVDVIDAETGAALKSIVLEKRPRSRHCDGGPAPRVTRLGAQGADAPTSPVEVPRSAFPRESHDDQLWIGAPGRDSVEIAEPPAGVDRMTVRLGPASSVEVLVRGMRSDDQLTVQVHDVEGRLLAERDADDSVMLFEDLLPQSLSLLVVAKHDQRLQLAERPFDCTPGACARVVLDLDAGEEGAPGMLVVDWVGRDLPNWSAEARLSATVRPDEPRAAHTRSGKMNVASAVKDIESNVLGTPHFEQFAEGLPPGRYRVELEPLGVRRTLDVAPGQSTHATIVIPDLARTAVTFIDVSTGAVVAPRRAHGVLRTSQGVLAIEPFGNKGASGVIEFVSEPGELRVDCQDGNYACSTHVRQTVSAGWNAITVELVPAARLVLVWNQADVDPSVDVTSGVVVLDADGHSVQLGFSQVVDPPGGGVTIELQVPAAVPLTVTIPATARCAEATFELELSAGTRERRVITCSP